MAIADWCEKCDDKWHMLHLGKDAQGTVVITKSI
jgi:hypothetical protein